MESNIGEVDYAILKSVNYLAHLNKNLDEEIREITNILNVRSIIIEKHIFLLIKNEFIAVNEKCQVAQKGEDAINEYEKNNEGWIKIDNFIVNQIKNIKERSLKIYTMADKLLFVLIVLLTIYIIYIGLGMGAIMD